MPPFIMTRYFFNRSRLLDYLRGLESANDVGKSVYLTPGASQEDVQESLAHELSQLKPEETEQIYNQISASKTGAVLFRCASHIILVLPPLPLTGSYIAQGCMIEPLRSLVEKDYTIAIVLLRMGSFAVGVCRGEELLTSKVGTGLVHQRHRAGGSSSTRFRRHREKQIEAFLTRVCGHACEHIEPYAKIVDYMQYGGSRESLQLLNKSCPFLSRFEGRTLPPLLDIADPRQVVLEQAVKRLATTRVLEWKQSD